MKDTAIKMYKMKKYFIHNHKNKYACELREMYENIQIALLKKVQKRIFYTITPISHCKISIKSI